MHYCNLGTEFSFFNSHKFSRLATSTTHEYKQKVNFIRRAVFITCEFQLAMNHEMLSTEMDLLRENLVRGLSSFYYPVAGCT